MKTCQLCRRQNLTQYVDGKTVHGPWADMCVTCHKVYGHGLGLGRGQQYELVDGKWLKIAG